MLLIQSSEATTDLLTSAGYTATMVGKENSNDVLQGTEENNVIVGLSGNDQIFGNGGDDVICGGDGDDVLIGGADNDTLLGRHSHMCWYWQ
jgi:Ca2+-binding RTX toxin-like protein